MAAWASRLKMAKAISWRKWPQCGYLSARRKRKHQHDRLTRENENRK